MAAALLTPAANADEGHHHGGESVCDENHPAAQELIQATKDSLAHVYTDAAVLIATGYIPYFDVPAPMVGHWLNPEYIGDGALMDPLRPESVVVDEWNRPIGVMYIGDDGVPLPPIYVDEETGVECRPVHAHTDTPALFAWWYYKMVYGGAAYEGDVMMPEVTAEMIHVWVVDSPGGAFGDAYPENRQGPPGPIPGMRLPEGPDQS